MAGSTLGVYGQIVKELKEDAAAFQMMEIVHERREADYDAHALARKHALQLHGRRVWYFDPLKTF
jgi:hypothetical protein